MLTRPFTSIVCPVVLLLAAVSIAWGWPASPYSDMAARQDLHDLVCFLSSDGHISGPHRALVLDRAKRMLPPQEFRSFKHAIDRISPPERPHRNGNSGSAASRPMTTAQVHKPSPPHAVHHKMVQRQPRADQRARGAVSQKSPSNHAAGVASASRGQDSYNSGKSASPMKVAAKPRSSEVRNIAPPPPRSDEPGRLPAPAREPKPAAEPEGPNLVVPVTALLPDRMATSRGTR